MRRSFVLALAVALPACFRLPPTPTPMASLFYAAPAPPAKCLLVLFPGARDRAGTFDEEGFIAAIRASGLSVDVVSADATMGYYLQSTAALRLETDVIGPARAKGAYAQVWLLGISMGGYGAFHYAQTYPDHVDGLAAFAPFLGEEEAWGPVRDGGGLAKLRPPPVVAPNDQNYGAQLWGFLHTLTRPGVERPALYLGTGDSDRLREPFEVLAAEVPRDHVFRTEGGHSWGPWRDLLRQFLSQSAFKDRCGS